MSESAKETHDAAPGLEVAAKVSKRWLIRAADGTLWEADAPEGPWTPAPDVEVFFEDH